MTSARTRTAYLAGRIVDLIGRAGVLCLAALAGTAALFQVENAWEPVPFALATTATIGGVLLVASGRLIFSFYMAWLLVAVPTAISLVKYQLKGFSFHYYDVVFAGLDTEIIGFLFGSYLHIIAPLLMMLVATILGSVLLFKFDCRQRFGRFTLVLCVFLPIICLPLTFPSEATHNRYVYYLQGRHMTAFFVSLLDLEYIFTDEKLENRLANMPRQHPFDTAVVCPEISPDVFIVLGESQTDPAIFPQLKMGPLVSQQMAKANGALQPLNVETFGGGTWISSLSLMTGLPASEFGWRSPYLTVELEGKVQGSLPSVFADCGYRTIALLPMNDTFVNEGPFLRSIGFETVIDRSGINAPSYHMRDSFYYAAAERLIAEHRETDGRPLFFAMQTMFPHSPYEKRLEPDVVVQGEPLHPDKPLAEYLRRLSISSLDLEAFLAIRRSQADQRGLVVLNYGDHQTHATKPLVDETAGTNAMGIPGSLAYRTFFTLRHIDPIGTRNYETTEPVDIALLGSKLLSFAELPSSQMWDDVARLDRLCASSLSSCEKRGQIDRHLRRRIDSNLLQLGSNSVVSALEQKLRASLPEP